MILFAHTLGIGRRESRQVQGEGLESVDGSRWPRWMRMIKAMAWMQLALLLLCCPCNGYGLAVLPHWPDD
ncbi:hypothetical protein JCM19237_3526 [Photobacterium aphoticum]|uniref:Uncharacterized protein n=1 Tax=Photobacterium aphoticum TaxID=754436 RepID=A0A090QSA2_9GAMM|nr:hypothetical protein JCM19237_3526 [Photobacterium aphoticum]